jgi:hypothetical protein
VMRMLGNTQSKPTTGEMQSWGDTEEIELQNSRVVKDVRRSLVTAGRMEKPQVGPSAYSMEETCFSF